MKGRIYFVSLGVDAVYHKPIYHERRNYILSVGRDNGRDYKAVMEVALLLPEREFHVVCSPRNIKDIQNIPRNVKVFFDLSPKELYEKYKEAQLLLLLTKSGLRTDGADCSGQTVLLDAMANGLPVIVTEQEYLSDYARDGKEAIYVHSYDSEEIKACIEKMYDAQMREDIAKKARRRVEKELTTEKMAKELARVFKK
jgi:glycosyltransferase involved in cell wall biosynthesis